MTEGVSPSTWPSPYGDQVDCRSTTTWPESTRPHEYRCLPPSERLPSYSPNVHTSQGTSEREAGAGDGSERPVSGCRTRVPRKRGERPGLSGMPVAVAEQVSADDDGAAVSRLNRSPRPGRRFATRPVSLPLPTMGFARRCLPPSWVAASARAVPGSGDDGVREPAPDDRPVPPAQRLQQLVCLRKENVLGGWLRGCGAVAPIATGKPPSTRWGVSSNRAACRRCGERAALRPLRRRGVLLPAHRLVGARACVPGWWGAVRRPWPCTSRNAGGRTVPGLADRPDAWRTWLRV